MDGEDDSEGGNTFISRPVTPIRDRLQPFQNTEKTPRANRGHANKRFATADHEGRPTATTAARGTSLMPSNISTGDKRGRQDDEDVFQGTTNDWANEVERDVGERSIALLREQIEDTIAAARHFASNRGRADEGDLAELAQTLIAELTTFVSPEKALSTEVMIQRVYSKQEKMERKTEVFESMQAELDKRERKSNERQMEEVRTSIHIPDYAAVTASLPRGGHMTQAPAHQAPAKGTRLNRPHPQTTTTTPLPNPNRAYNPCRMVVRAPELPIDYVRLRPEEVATRVNEELGKHSATKDFVVVHVRFNVNNSCILNLRSDQRAADLEPYAIMFKHVVFPGHEDVEAYPDEKWYSVHICGVRTGIIDGPDGDGIRTANEVRRELMAKNPDLRGRTIRGLRWVRPEGKLLEEAKYALSVVALFEKEEDARYMTEERRNVSLY
ncbi:hypothetical protein EDD18DRAFT_364324 [Armillaria luteobubalina]|uniref:Uncharacterized protein n=1 Tax=Armillaria luteobubalina TaxID=153913 RepID=A0AA39Q3M3_9AGAR|nr:hypothetical protein EDD18DRAFT_364324 [Armillaria luteobubalina]